jgi:hypothetical protein
MPEAEREMPQIQFGPHTISRLIVGGNQQQGATHQPKHMTLHMAEYYTVDGTIAFIKDCVAKGIDTWQANNSPKTREVVRRVREDGDEINLISLSAPQMAEGDGWANLMDLKPIGIYLFGSIADMLWQAGKIDTAKDFLSKIRDSGVQVGLGTHRPEVIEYAEEKGWDVDFYMASLYWWGRSREQVLDIMPEVPHDGLGGMDIYMPSELPRMCDTIAKASKQCLAFKLFAGGRTCGTPEQVGKIFEKVLGAIKPEDAVVVGMYPRFSDEITEDADWVRKYS